jgi:propionyl-CoA synthetase
MVQTQRPSSEANLGFAAFQRRSIEDKDGFWKEQADLIHWHQPFERVLNYSNPPFTRWFEGGLTNLCYNAVDRHVASLGLGFD